MRVDGTLVGVKAHGSLDFRRYTAALLVLCIYCLGIISPKKHLHEYRQARSFETVLVHGHVNAPYRYVSRIFNVE